MDFPGPVSQSQDGPALSGVAVKLPLTNRDDFVSGTGEGFLAFSRYNPTSESFSVLHRFFLGGQVVSIVPWLGRSGQDPGLVVATVDPDRVVFLQVNQSFPYLAVVTEVALEENPGDLAFVGNTATGPWEMAVGLPGIDQIAFLAEDQQQWSVRAMVPSGDRPSSLIGVDLDEDSIAELVVAQTGPLSETLGIFRRQSDASYVMETVVLPTGVPGLVAAHDLDDDGHRELAVGLADRPEVVFYRENAGALVELDRAALTFAAGTLRLLDLSNGEVGLLAGNDERGLLELVSLGPGGWTRLDTYYPGCRPHDFFFADLDGDTLPDLIALGGDAEIVTAMLGNGKPGFWGLPALGLQQSPGSFVCDDIDGDGRRDLLIADASATTLSLFRGTPSGPLALTAESWDLGYIPGDIIATDLDDDPELEIAVLDLIASEVEVLDFSPETGFTTLSRTPVGTFPFSMATGDLDNDGTGDLLVLTLADPEVTALFGHGDGTMAEVTTLGFSFTASRILPLDLNDDGLLDLVASDGLSRVWTKVNLGGRQFGDQGFVNAGVGALDMQSADLDKDGDFDLVVANRTEQSLSFLENTGSGVLTRRIGGHALPGRPAGLVLEDFDGDGRTDVMVNLQTDGFLSLVLGIGDWTYAVPAQFGGGPEMSGIGVADFNLDGVPDVLALDRSLLLGLTLLNVDPGQVAVAPTALEASCDPEGLLLRIRPDRPGPWRLELGQPGQWRPAMTSGRALVGVADYDAGIWFLRLDTETLAAWSPDGGPPSLARLTVGTDEQRETLVWSLNAGCLEATGAPVPRVAWQSEPWPNPFNPRVQASFRLGRAAPVTVAVYDLAGRQVALLARGTFAAGEHLVHWDGRGEAGPAGAGIYFLRIDSAAGKLSRKVVLLK